MTVYQLGIGDRLVDPSCFPDAISTYLWHEEMLLRKLCTPYKAIVEAGCTRGRYAGIAQEKGKRYTGVDNVQRYIAAAEAEYSMQEHMQFICADVNNADTWLPFVHTNSLLVFPFNIFGILNDPQSVLKAIKTTGNTVVVFVFSTSGEANAARMHYYRQSGFDDLQYCYETAGVRFTSSKGLNSMAYHTAWFAAAAQQTGYRMQEYFFGTIGKAFFFYR